MNRQPNKFEKDFMDAVIWYGETIGGIVEGHGRIQIHHVAGKSYKNNKIHIGYWFLLPLPWSLHDPNSPDELNITKYRKRFTDEFGTQRELYFKMVDRLRRNNKPVPPLDIMGAIADTRY